MTVAMTLRLDQNLKDHLGKISELRKTPMNKLATLALQQFVAAETRSLEAELEASLAALKVYRDSNPEFETAIDGIVVAELSTANDPAQGEVIEAGDSETTAKVRSLLSA